MNTDENITASAHAEGDNLEDIHGIGPGYAKALNRIGVFRVADLLKYNTPEELWEALKEKGEKIPLKIIKDKNWLGQARDKVPALPANVEHPSPREKAETALDSQQPSPKEEWDQHAGFNLYFEFRMDEQGQKEWQTNVFKSLEPDNFEDNKRFPGIEPAPWLDWILKKAELPEDAGPFLTETEVAAEPVPTETEAAEPPTPVTPDAAGVEILDVQISEVPPSAGIPENRLKVETRFQLSGTEAEKLMADNIPFRVEVHTVDLKSKASNLVALELGQLQPEVFEYTNQQEFSIPEVGRYKVQTRIALLPPLYELTASFDGPTFKVSPMI